MFQWEVIHSGFRSWIFLRLIFLFLGANGQPIDCCSNGNNPFDLTFEPDTVAVCFPIQIPRNDPFYRGKKTCMNFARSETAPDMDCQPGPLQQVNQISHWLDGSNIYGSSRWVICNWFFVKVCKEEGRGRWSKKPNP